MIKRDLTKPDPVFNLCVALKYVPDTCLFSGEMVYMLTNLEGDACARCNHDRDVCKGRPRKEAR